MNRFFLELSNKSATNQQQIKTIFPLVMFNSSPEQLLNPQTSIPYHLSQQWNNFFRWLSSILPLLLRVRVAKLATFNHCSKLKSVLTMGSSLSYTSILLPKTISDMRLVTLTMWPCPALRLLGFTVLSGGSSSVDWENFGSIRDVVHSCPITWHLLPPKYDRQVRYTCGRTPKQETVSFLRAWRRPTPGEETSSFLSKSLFFNTTLADCSLCCSLFRQDQSVDCVADPTRRSIVQSFNMSGLNLCTRFGFIPAYTHVSFSFSRM